MPRMLVTTCHVLYRFSICLCSCEMWFSPACTVELGIRHVKENGTSITKTALSCYPFPHMGCPATSYCQLFALKLRRWPEIASAKTPRHRLQP